MSDISDITKISNISSTDLSSNGTSIPILPPVSFETTGRTEIEFTGVPNKWYSYCILDPKNSIQADEKGKFIISLTPNYGPTTTNITIGDGMPR